MSWPKQHLLSFVLALYNHHTFWLPSTHLASTPLLSIHLNIPLKPLWVRFNHIFKPVHLHYDYIDTFSHPKPDRASALIDPHSDFLTLLAPIVLIWWVLVEVEVMQVEALLELILAELIPVSAYLHDVFEGTPEQLFTQGHFMDGDWVLWERTGGVIVEGGLVQAWSRDHRGLRTWFKHSVSC